MGDSSCSISGFFEPEITLISSYTLDISKSDGFDIFGNKSNPVFNANFYDNVPNASQFNVVTSISGVYKNTEILKSRFICIPESSEVVSENCGALIFNQTCSSAHIATIGL